MTYKLEFIPQALKEWEKLGSTVKEQFKKKLSERLEIPHVPADKLRESKNRYKIKLRASGYRLAYEVFDDRLVVTVVAVGKRKRAEIYKKAKSR